MCAEDLSARSAAWPNPCVVLLHPCVSLTLGTCEQLAAPVVKQPNATIVPLIASFAPSDTASGADIDTSSGAPTVVAARLASDRSYVERRQGGKSELK